VTTIQELKLRAEASKVSGAFTATKTDLVLAFTDVTMKGEKVLNDFMTAALDKSCSSELIEFRGEELLSNKVDALWVLRLIVYYHVAERKKP
jgi:hypothetical protein